MGYTNDFKARGQANYTKPDAGGTVINPVPMIGIVKDNIDPQRAGRIFVYIADNSGLDPDDRNNWRPMRYMSPFYGRTTPSSNDDGFGTYKANPSSYGEWHSPPDIGTQVICIFVGGQTQYGYYIGCIPEPEALQMVPAIGATDNIVPNQGEAQSYGGAKRLPVTNINTNNPGIADTVDYIKAPKPVHSYQAAIMAQQGILRDPVRGPISSSAQREAASRVGWGVSTPGRPIYEGGYTDETITDQLDPGKAQGLRVVSRRGGHSIVMDDGDIIGRDQLIRIRTALGHQIMMSDDGQTLMILHSNGQSYVELGKEGTVDIYSTNSFNVRTQGDLNLHADNNVNIFAGNNLNVQATNITVASEEAYNQNVGTDYQLSASGKHTSKVGGAFSVDAGGQASMASAAEAFVNGSKVNLNSGKTSTIPQDVLPPTKILHTDTLFDETTGFSAAPAKLASITSRAPAHYPWAAAGQGVDVKVSLDAASQLPAAPSGPVGAVNAAANATDATPVGVGTVASVPQTGAVSQAIDKNTTSAVLGAVATNAATGPLKAATTQGAAIANTAQGVQVGVGQFAQTPQQLEAAGVIKPGSAATVQAIAEKTGNVKQAMAGAVFTGQAGAQNLTSFVNNVPAQAQAVVTNLQQAQTGLTNAGVITGKESPTQIAGVVTAAATSGLTNTVNSVKGVASSVAGGISNVATAAAGAALGAAAGAANAVGGAVNGVLKGIKSGNLAAGIAEGAAGALGGISESVKAMGVGVKSIIDQTKGAAASAFQAVKATFKPMKAGEPQNLTKLAEEAAASAAAEAQKIGQDAQGAMKGAQDAVASKGLSATGAAGVIKNAATNAAADAAATATSGAKGALGGALGKVGSVVGGVVGGVVGAATGVAVAAVGGVANTITSVATAVTGGGGLKNAAQAVQSGAQAAASAASSSGITNLPGGPSVVGNIVNKASNAVTGAIGAVGNAITGAVSSVTGSGAVGTAINNVVGGTVGAVTGAISGAVGAVAGGISGAANAIASGKGLVGSIKDAGAAALNGLKAPDALEKLKQAGGGLSALAKAGVPAGTAAALDSLVSSVAGSASQVKLPTVAVNTTERGPVDESVKTNLGDPGIPPPNLTGEVSESAKATVQDKAKRREEFLEKWQELNPPKDAAVAEFRQARDLFIYIRDYGQDGDPQKQVAYDRMQQKGKIALEKIKKVEALLNEYPEFQDSLVAELNADAQKQADTKKANTLTEVQVTSRRVGG